MVKPQSSKKTIQADKISISLESESKKHQMSVVIQLYQEEQEPLMKIKMNPKEFVNLTQGIISLINQNKEWHYFYA
jgi:hypothetical protein